MAFPFTYLWVCMKRLTLLTILFFALFHCVFSQELYPFKENGLWGLKTLTGKVIVAPAYDYIEQNYDGYHRAKFQGKWGALNAHGKVAVKFKYNYLSGFYNDGWAVVRETSLFGMINQRGRIVIPLEYNSLWYFKDGLCPAEKDEVWGFIDKKNTAVIPFEYDGFGSCNWSEGLVTAKREYKWGFIDRNNHVVIPFIYLDALSFSEGLAMVADSNYNFGFINHQNEPVIPFIYGSPYNIDFFARSFHDGVAAVNLQEKTGFINQKGETVIPFKYCNVGPFFDGYAAVEVDRLDSITKSRKVIRYGYVDSTGREFLVPYGNTDCVNWRVGPAPAGLPDFSDTLMVWDLTLKQNFFSTTVKTIKDSKGRITDTIEFGMICRGDTLVWDTLHHIDIPSSKWTLPRLLNAGLNAFVNEPKTYADLNKNDKVAVGYGLLISGGNYSEAFMYPNWERWELFKKETIYKIIGDENLRQAAWDWVAPYYKQAFQFLHPFHQKTYKDIARALKEYINNYDIKKTENYLKRDERNFAHLDADGKKNPYRKLFAFVDRLILVHKVISLEDARRWINKIVDEVLSW